MVVILFTCRGKNMNQIALVAFQPCKQTSVGVDWNEVVMFQFV